MNGEFNGLKLPNCLFFRELRPKSTGAGLGGAWLLKLISAIERIMRHMWVFLRLNCKKIAKNIFAISRFYKINNCLFEWYVG